ncbi:MAG: sigma-70 family RNA polymerase sigma factor [Armatimonadota bacterium]|nr:sigma-70 family RNA polymerase sigma factor [Armatimonadota bacterium]MCX7776777.1 sigma-70 family RNA polymerase sigma factor [Armatimonadota bacterium]MDW8024574.1 sigma-70 family RNA polymerase sigma factor [Armatimonadota bacterium]
MGQRQRNGGRLATIVGRLGLTRGRLSTVSIPEHERELLRRCKAGDEDAWREFIDTYKHMVYSFAYDLLRNPEDAEDVAQEVFINAFRAIGSFRGDSRISTWLYRVTKNACLNFIRQRDKAVWESLDDQEGNWEELLDRDDDMPTPEELVLHEELREIVRRKIDELPHIYRTAIIMCDIRQLNYEEAARILNIPVGTLKSQVFRARRMLKEKLKSYWLSKHPMDGNED